MAVELAGARSGAPPAEEDSSGSAPSGSVRTCSTCSLPVNRHFGPVGGPSRCWGASQCGPHSAFASAFAELRELISSTRAELRTERTEAKDRENRLKIKLDAVTAKLSAVTGELTACQDAFSRLAAQVKKASGHADGSDRVPRAQRNNRQKRKAQQPGSAAGPAHRHWADRSDCSGVEFARESLSSSDENDDRGPPSSRPRHHVRASSPSRTDSHQSRTDSHQQPSARQLSTPVQQAAAQRTSGQPANRASAKPRFSAMESEDESWKLVTKKKPRARRAELYVGNLSEDATADDVVRFIAERADRVGVDQPRVQRLLVQYYLIAPSGRGQCTYADGSSRRKQPHQWQAEAQLQLRTPEPRRLQLRTPRPRRRNLFLSNTNDV